jgi:hypothetical protein
LSASETHRSGLDSDGFRCPCPLRYYEKMEYALTKDQVQAVLDRVATWPDDRQRELAEVVLEIEAELACAECDAPPDESAAIDEGLAAEAASGEEVNAAFAVFRRA